MNCLISTADLADHLNDPDWVVIDCRFQLADPQWGRSQYHHSHIPGAYYADLNQDLSAPVGPKGGRHPLPEPDQLAAKLTAMGVVWGQTPVVVYDDARFAFGSRLWWLLRYYGHKQVQVLDGGWPAWVREDRPVTEAIPTPRAGAFTPQLQRDWVVDIATVQQPERGFILVDCRDRDRYLGHHEPIDPIAGHIPGAINRPWREITTAAGYSQSPEVQRDLWADLPWDQELVVYCGSGVTACVNLLSLTVAGRPWAKLYPGGWSDWCAHLSNTA
ncbi:sulfurtransferase [Spirulina sp. CCNP1310]|uniref:sulfurtransferase n=1 Tax=Spirulina sp. CCNP1310 TaxID=3110249 RepID=UPI002B1EE40C|nr:sulfurtransferase [Spirulina sp. CCNP1310]MEA5417965.1 sulfurtransferase [Spirulina sp. CCNP1310]